MILPGWLASQIRTARAAVKYLHNPLHAMISPEDDEVVRELEVFVTDSTLDLFLLQFPLRPQFAGATIPPRFPSARFKKQFKRLEVEIPFESPSSSSSSQKPAIKQTFHSATVAKSTCLAAAIIRDDAMHITPLQDVLQMRPLFKSKQGAGKWDDVEGDSDGEEANKEVPPLEQVLLKRRETERTQSARTQSYTHMQQQEEGDPWLRLTAYGMDTPESYAAAQQCLLYHPDAKDEDVMDVDA